MLSDNEKAILDEYKALLAEMELLSDKLKETDDTEEQDCLWYEIGELLKRSLAIRKEHSKLIENYTYILVD